MSRGTLTLYQLDREQLKRLSAELECLLGDDDRAGLASLLELDLGVRAVLDRTARLVDILVRPDHDSEAAPVFVALRRAGKRRALTATFTSDNPALEGRLRAFDALREDATVAEAIDKLLSPKRLPWYLRVSGATCGWIDDDQRKAIVLRSKRIRSTLTQELAAFAAALDEIEGDVVAHDGL
jgi:hypothetical protein